MIMQLFKKKKELTFERRYAAPVSVVWDAWTRPEMLREWWGPDKTIIPECEVDLRIGGRIRIVMEAGEAMGKYAGTRWPMEGEFTRIDPHTHLAYDARSWTEGDDDATIDHVNQVEFVEEDGKTRVNLTITINAIGPGAKMAAFGMRWGYKAQLDKLETFLESRS